MSTKKDFFLKGIDLLSLAVGYNSTGDEPERDKNEKPYRVMVHNGIAFRVEEPSYQRWKAGKVYAFKMMETTREIEDEKNPGQMITVPALEFANDVSYEQYTALRKFEVEDKLLEQRLMAEIASKTKELDPATLQS